HNGVVLEMQIGLLETRVKGGPADPSLKRMEGETFKVTLDGGQKVTKVEGHEGLAKQVTGTDQGPAYQMVLGTLEKTLRFWVENMFYPVTPADGAKSWKREAETDTNIPLTLEKTFTLDRNVGEDGCVVRVAGEFRIPEGAPAAGPAGGLPLQILSQGFHPTLS